MKKSVINIFAILFLQCIVYGGLVTINPLDMAFCIDKIIPSFGFDLGLRISIIISYGVIMLLTLIVTLLFKLTSKQICFGLGLTVCGIFIYKFISYDGRWYNTFLLFSMVPQVLAFGFGKVANLCITNRSKKSIEN